MWCKNFTVVGPEKVITGASLRVEDGTIAEIVPYIVPNGVDGEGLTLCPGFIDMHGDMIELEVEPRAGVDFPKNHAIAHLDARMAACGFTTAYAAISFCTNSFRGERRSREHSEGIIKALHEEKLTVGLITAFMLDSTLISLKLGRCFLTSWLEALLI